MTGLFAILRAPSAWRDLQIDELEGNLDFVCAFKHGDSHSRIDRRRGGEIELVRGQLVLSPARLVFPGAAGRIAARQIVNYVPAGVEHFDTQHVLSRPDGLQNELLPLFLSLIKHACRPPFGVLGLASSSMESVDSVSGAPLSVTTSSIFKSE